MNLSPFVFVFLWLLAMAVLVGVSWWRKWHRELAAARHTYHAAAQDVEATTVFYGSMQLDAERNWRIAATGQCGLAPAEPRCDECPFWPVCEEADAGHWNDPRARPLDWRERTMAELAPEALDPGPGNAPLVDPGPAERLCGPEQPHEKPAGTESAGSGHLAPTREDDQGRAVRVCASESRPAAGADLTGSLSSRPHQEDPGWLAHGQPGPASLAPVLERLAGIGDIHEAHQTHPHPEDGWLDAQLADLYDWVRTQLEAA